MYFYFRNRTSTPRIPTPDPDPIVISDTDDGDVEIIMVRPLVRPVAISPETSDEETSDEETSDEEISDAESDIEDCISVIPDSPCPAPVALPGHSAQNNSQERITIFPEPARTTRGQWPWCSTKKEETLGKTIDADESHTESDSDSDTDGALTNSSRSLDEWKPKASSGKKKQAPKAANGVYPNTRSSKRKLVANDRSAKGIDTPSPTDDNRDSAKRRLDAGLRKLGLKELVEMFQDRLLWQGEGELRRLCDQLAATRDETLTLFPRFQKVVFNLWPELVRHVPEAEGLLAPLNKAWDDWVTFDYRLATFRARVQDALERRTSQVQIGFWVDRDNRRRAHSIPRVGKALDALESLTKILVCGAAMASLRIDGSDAAPRSQDDDRISGETGSALKQLKLLVGEITM